MMNLKSQLPFLIVLFYFCFIFVFLNLEPSVVGLGCFFKLGS